jgi:drug/metabolite transporter (DMT)-like permease
MCSNVLQQAHVPHLLRFGTPLLFVLIWSTGFVVAKVAAPHGDLQLFLALRFSLTAAAMGLAALAAGAKWPRGRELWPHLLAGALMQGVYLCASYWAIARGLAVGVMALLGALQPLFTALFLAATRRMKLESRTWSGLLIGFGGVGFVLAPKLASSGVGSLTGPTVGAALLSVIAVTAGTLSQKWLAKTDLRSAASVQNLGGATICFLVMLVVGTDRWDGAPILWSALLWAVLVLSVVGTTLLMWMMRHGEATKVTALLLLVPPLAAIQAYVIFRETLAPVQIIGFVLALGGVLLTRSARMPDVRPAPARPASS